MDDDRVRRGEHRVLKREGAEWLTGSKYLWPRRPAELSPEHRVVLQALPREDFKVGRAWAAQGAVPDFWECRYPRGGPDPFFLRWFWRATHSRLQATWWSCMARGDP